MPRQPTFDKERLLELLGEWVDRPWTYQELANELAAWNEANGRAGVVPAATTLAVAVHRLRQANPDLEVTLRDMRVVDNTLAKQLAANAGRKIAAEHVMAFPVRRLRQIDRLRAGLPVVPEYEGPLARGYEMRLRRDGLVVDIDELGRPFERPALDHEKTVDGDLLDIICQPVANAEGVAALRVIRSQEAELNRLRGELGAVGRVSGGRRKRRAV